MDTETGQLTVQKLVVSSDVGRAINPLVCRGQDEGAALMGMSQALFERMVYDGTRLVNGEPLVYRVPLAEDLPYEFISITQEQGHGPGPFGAKGGGEGCVLPGSGRYSQRSRRRSGRAHHRSAYHRRKNSERSPNQRERK